MDRKVINGIQQIGIGTTNAQRTFDWYRKNLGFDIKVFEDVATAELMLPYTNGKPRQRHAILSMNLRGGGGLEIWQYVGRTPTAPEKPLQLGDLGINIMKIRSHKVAELHKALSNSVKFITEVSDSPEGAPHFYFQDPEGNLVEIYEDKYTFSPENNLCGGVLGTVTGVSDIQKSITFYREILGYDVVAFEKEEVFSDFNGLPNGSEKFKRALLKHNPNRKAGGFSKLLGPTHVELIQATERTPYKIYENRMWGDLGYIHQCFDITGMDLLREECAAKGSPFTVDSSNSFDMGDAAGHFSYIEDPDGTLIEFVETHKVPVLKKLGLFINLKKRNPLKPLPNWMVKSMKMHRVK